MEGKVSEKQNEVVVNRIRSALCHSWSPVEWLVRGRIIPGLPGGTTAACRQNAFAAPARMWRRLWCVTLTAGKQPGDPSLFNLALELYNEEKNHPAKAFIYFILFYFWNFVRGSLNPGWLLVPPGQGQALQLSWNDSLFCHCSKKEKKRILCPISTRSCTLSYLPCCLISSHADYIWMWLCLLHE